MTDPHRVLFVCLGNICRSPLAEGVFRHLVATHPAGGAFEIDSAGTGAYHVGEAPDRRMRQVARAHGIDIEGLRARQVQEDDFQRFDWILAMDQANLRNLKRLETTGCAAKVRLFRSFDPEGEGDVPDPYYEGKFDEVYTIILRTAEALHQHLCTT